MKIIKIILSSFCALAFFLTVTIPILSSYMQGYYKGLIGVHYEDTRALLEKKKFWSQLGETKVFFYVFLASVFVLIVYTLIIWLKKRVHKQKT